MKYIATTAGISILTLIFFNIGFASSPASEEQLKFCKEQLEKCTQIARQCTDSESKNACQSCVKDCSSAASKCQGYASFASGQPEVELVKMGGDADIATQQCRTLKKLFTCGIKMSRVRPLCSWLASQKQN